jgi:hypothetical protein
MPSCRQGKRVQLTPPSRRDLVLSTVGGCSPLTRRNSCTLYQFGVPVRRRVPLPRSGLVQAQLCTVRDYVKCRRSGLVDARIDAVLQMSKAILDFA